MCIYTLQTLPFLHPECFSSSIADPTPGSPLSLPEPPPLWAAAPFHGGVETQGPPDYLTSLPPCSAAVFFRCSDDAVRGSLRAAGPRFAASRRKRRRRKRKWLWPWPGARRPGRRRRDVGQRRLRAGPEGEGEAGLRPPPAPGAPLGPGLPLRGRVSSGPGAVGLPRPLRGVRQPLAPSRGLSAGTPGLIWRWGVAR